VTDNASNTSNPLDVTDFTIDTVKPVLTQVTAVTTPTDNTTQHIVSVQPRQETNSYGGNCGSSSTSAISEETKDNVTIILTHTDNSTALSERLYGDCRIKVTDAAGNTSDALPVNTFEVDITAPTVDSTYPTDNLSSVSVSDNISVTFSESMDNTSVTTNTSNTTCSGSLQLSSDSFSTCVQMGSSPSNSDNKTFTVTPSSKMFYSTTYKIRVTTAAKDSAGNDIADNDTQTYGFDTSITIPTTAGSAHSCHMLDNGSVKCWGKNNLGQLGLGHTSNRGDNSSYMGDNLPVVDLGIRNKATAIAAGGNHTCAILDNASIKCWGIMHLDNWAWGIQTTVETDLTQWETSLPSVDLGSGIKATANRSRRQSHLCYPRQRIH
jgi:hypothetical protein